VVSNPKPGQRVQVWYRKGLRDYMPHHGRLGTVAVVSKGRPRNHGVLIDGRMVVIPCGNLRPPTPAVN
jgi:hypothetical protein